MIQKILKALVSLRAFIFIKIFTFSKDSPTFVLNFFKT
ncbi:Hypothetical Protein SLY_0019 [Strawberry lethal yellows phytoplasma (CPA) str. NZSb11]|uniref:Uncharacterized protein n=1 Tax=Strawberry lethal yellows phytoplasma (CPA) str. NZSb11 TaxID=980422 RepID=R4RKW5_PHYAS|nr:Hypothetical Protein SLY_0019 [Strawberry lethal yellows phytoplasma (CPA) str. NZSb11]